MNVVGKLSIGDRDLAEATENVLPRHEIAHVPSTFTPVDLTTGLKRVTF
jgi:hypothetical protein